ncbi:MAG: hypothetical protein ACTSRI_18105 [Promethearchaeota archaeon]
MTFLTYLEDKYPGLTGEVVLGRINSEVYNRELFFYELIVPQYPYLNSMQFSIIAKFIHLFGKVKNSVVQLFIMWQRDDSINGKKFYNETISELYKVKIYLRYALKNELVPTESLKKEELRLEARLESLPLEIKNLKGERAKIYPAPPNTWRNILTSKTFWVNRDDVDTTFFYNLHESKLPREKIPAFLSPDQVDFTFTENNPLPRAHFLRFENLKVLPYNESNNGYIWIGKHVRLGVVKENNALIPVNNFSQSVIIGGQSGVGKSRLLGQICSEFYEKTPKIGVLFINLGKGNQENLYKIDKILKYGDLDLKIPYYIKGEYLEKGLQETASYLTASMGLKSPVDKIMYLVEKSFFRKNGDMPQLIQKLFRGLKKWYEVHQYHDKYQTNILRAIENRVLHLLSDPILEKILEYNSKSIIPTWFRQWRLGKKIFIDLSMCTIHVKWLLSNAMFQMVRTLTPDVEVGRIQNIIVMDEAHQILRKPKGSYFSTDDSVALEELERIFDILLREFRSKGLAFFLADQTPSDLFECVTKLPSLKILFRMGKDCVKRFFNSLEDQDFVGLLKDRHALVLNGVKAERYVIKTIDYEYRVPPKYASHGG